MNRVARVKAAPLCVALAFAALWSTSASGQGRQRNPYSSLFGDPVERGGSEYTALHLRSTAGVQIGRTLEQQGLPPGSVVPDGLGGGADVSMLGQYMRDKTQVYGQARYSYAEYRQDPPIGVPAIDAGIRASVRPRTRISFQGGASFARSPYYQLVWLPSDVASPLPPVGRGAIALLENDSTQYDLGATSYYTSRSRIEFSALYRQTDFADSTANDYSTVGGMVRWSRQMNRDLAVHAGYGREQLRQRNPLADTVYINDRIDVGVDYGKSLTLARRTFFSFGTETSMLRENGGPQRFRLNGHVTLDHHFRRTWELQATARRGTDFLPGFQGAVFSDHAHLAVGGHLATRLLLGMNLDGGRGEAGLQDPRKFISYGGSSRLTFAMTRHFGLFTQYAYFHYQSPGDPLTPLLIPRSARQAVSFGVETWMPIFDKEKVTRDSR